MILISSPSDFLVAIGYAIQSFFLPPVVFGLMVVLSACDSIGTYGLLEVL
ncbi:MAG: hypothetical protein IJT39_06750 [Bacteroidales bacterium]|nr:hypothetical protein [Bacteroidales bacterium]